MEAKKQSFLRKINFAEMRLLEQMEFIQQCDEETTNSNQVNEAEIRFEDVIQYLDEFSSVYAKNIDCLPDEDIQEAQKKFDNFSSNYHKVISKFQNFISTHTRLSTPTSNSSNNLVKTTRVRLPPIEIPKSVLQKEGHICENTSQIFRKNSKPFDFQANFQSINFKSVVPDPNNVMKQVSFQVSEVESSKHCLSSILKKDESKYPEVLSSNISSYVTKEEVDSQSSEVLSSKLNSSCTIFQLKT